MNELLKKIRLKDASAFTHIGKFHADDVFSSALLLYLNPEITILRVVFTDLCPIRFELFYFAMLLSLYLLQLSFFQGQLSL